MIVEKNGKIFSISEQSKKWVIKSNSGKLSVSYDVSKDLCATEDELREYIKSSDLF
jgi:hypothetical protein